MRYIDAIVAPPSGPPGWQPLKWEYEAVTFIAAKTLSVALAAALDREDAQVLALGDYDLTLPVLSDQVPWQHKPSRARYNSVLLPWPTYIFSPWIHGRPEAERRPPGCLIGDDCPVFPSYEAAFCAFFYGDFSPAPGGQVPSGFAAMRLVDRRAWLESPDKPCLTRDCAWRQRGCRCQS